MTEDEYVESIIGKYEVPRGRTSPAEQFGNAVSGPLTSWAGTQLVELKYSGSYAKQTGVHGVSDVDIFISLKSNTKGSLGEIYESLYAFAQQQGWSPRRQNVSIGVTIGGTQGDLVPGRVQDGYRNYHSLYLRKRNSWTQTNVSLHVDTVVQSQRLREIRAIKIWRKLHNLDFPSLYLELFVINALSGRSRTALASNVLHALTEVGSSLSTTSVGDPANTNNWLSDDLSATEKATVASAAERSARQRNWKDVIW